MAASSKFDLSSPDGPTYLNGQRSSYGAVSLERTGSFCEGAENRLSSLLPSMSRSSSTLSQGDMSNLFQSLFSDLRAVVLDQRFLRTVELKRLSSILGLSPEDLVPPTISTKSLPPSSLEELRRMKVSLRESSDKASDRAKAFAEAVSKIEKYCPNLSKKRSRGDISSSDRSNALFPGANMPKIGPQTHMNVNSLDLGPQKMEERAKANISNRRIRTSMMEGRMDARANGISRPSGLPDKDKEMYKLVNSGPTPSEEKGRALTSGVDGWEKPKLKKKRSVIKSDVSSSAVMTRPPDSDREPKRGTQQKLGGDARPRLSNAHGFRSGTVAGTIGCGKSDLANPQNNLGMRPSPRNDQDSSSLTNDRRDRVLGLDKEGSTVKVPNKQNGREENLAGSPTPLTKLNASVRAPRSNPGSISRASPNTHRVPANTDDWEQSQPTNKVNGFNRAINRKCSSSQLASPPVAQLVGQRPQKITRVARRSNLSPLASSHDEFTLTETIETASINTEGLATARHLSSNTQIKLKTDQTPPSNLLENEDSGVAESKLRDKTKKCSEIEEKSSQSMQKVATLVLPSRKSKVAAEEDTGDGVRRQGRIGRGYATTTSVMHATFDTSNIKQMRSARAGSEKIESKPGRPPSKKLSERRSYTRPRHSVNNVCLDSAEESDDDHEELLAAVNAAVNTMRACPSSFWKQIEPIFRFLSAEDITYLNQQIHLMDETCANTCAGHGSQSLKDDLGYVSRPSITAPGNSDGGDHSNGTSLTSCERQKQSTCHIKQEEPLLSQLVRGTVTQSGISICQALLSAIIEEEEVEKFYYASGKGEEYSYEDAYGVKYEVDTQLNPNGFHFLSSGNFQSAEGTHNGAKIHSWKYHDELLENNFGSNNGLLEPNTGVIPRHGNSLGEFFPNHSMTSCTEFEYNQMSIDDRILLELSEIGLHPEPVPDLTQSEEEDIVEGISNLEEVLHKQVMKMKSLLLKLEKTVTEAKEDQDRKLECIALDMLVGLAYNKYMACWGPSATGSKSMNKNMKHATLAFVKRTLARCQKFEKAGTSCFNEPVFRDIFFSMSSDNIAKENIDIASNGEASKRLTSSQHSESTIADLSPCDTSQPAQRDTHEKYSNSFRSVSQSSEQPNGRDEPWLNKVKRRELLLDDVVGSAGASLRPPSGLGSSLVTGTKGKRSGRDREGRGQNKDNASRVGTVKIGRPSLSNVKGERKNKTKPKQKLTQLSASVNGLLSRTAEPSDAALPSGSKSKELAGGSVKDKDLPLPPDAGGVQELCNLQLPELDVGDFGGQGQDIGSWLNIDDDDVLQDHDFMGLEIPMDDLSEVNMMV